MSDKPKAVAVQVTLAEALGAQLAMRAAATAGEHARLAGYELRPDQAQRLTRRLREATFGLARTVLETRPDASDEECDAWADELAAAVVREVLGPAPAAN